MSGRVTGDIVYLGGSGQPWEVTWSTQGAEGDEAGGAPGGEEEDEEEEEGKV